MTNNNLKVLCLSFRTPPQVRPQAILIGKMIPEWVRQGVKPIIITYREKEKWQIDLPIYKVDKFQLNRYLRRLPLIANLLEKF